MKRLVFPVILLIVMACGPATRITGTWVDPEIKAQGYSKIFVTAIMDKVLKRQYMEDEMTKVLGDKGVRASSSMGVMRPGFNAGRDADLNAVKDVISKEGYDGIMTIVLLDATDEVRFVPSGGMMHDPWMMGPMGMRGNMWGHHMMMSPMMMNPGFYTTDRNYFIEINLYDAVSENLVWSAQSQTTNPATLERFATGFAHATVNRMLRDNVLNKRSNAVANTASGSWE